MTLAVMAKRAWAPILAGCCVFWAWEIWSAPVSVVSKNGSESAK